MANAKTSLDFFAHTEALEAYVSVDLSKYQLGMLFKFNSNLIHIALFMPKMQPKALHG